jgi:hypothetical protein
MENAVIKIDAAQVVAQWEDPRVLTERIKRMLEIQKNVMKKDIHFGIITGCKQNSLYQPGSQILSVAFKLGHEPYKIEDLGSSDEIRYRVTDRVFLQGTDVTIAYGIGECSSSEEKYAWKRCYSEKEYEATPIDRKKIKYSEYNGKAQETKVIRTSPADVANTILKMARKRANVSGTIEALAASEVFTQDLEDLPEGMDLGNDRQNNSKSEMAPPTETEQNIGGQSDQAPPSIEERQQRGLISEGQEKRLYAICKTSKVDIEAVKNWIAVVKKVPRGHLWMLSKTKQGQKGSEYDQICDTAEKKPEFFLKYANVKTNGKASSSPDNAPPSQTAAQGQAGPSPFEEFEIKIQEIAETANKTALDAVMEICTTFKVKNISEIRLEQYPEVYKHLSEVL